MLAELAIGGSSILAGGGGVMLWHQIRNSFGKVPHTEPPPEPTLAEVMRRGNRVVAQMARDVHRLYHPPGEDGKPCACAYCEIRADDGEDEDEPEITAEQANEKRAESKQSKQRPSKKLAKWDPGARPTGDYNDCATHRKKGCVCKDEGMAPCPPPQSVYQQEKAKWETQVKNLEEQLAQLSEAYSKLKMGQDKKLVTKTVERESYMQSQFNELARIADAEGQVIQLTLEIQGRPVQITCGPQRPPDVELEQWGEPETIKRWTAKPHKIEIGVGRK